MSSESVIELHADDPIEDIEEEMEVSEEIPQEQVQQDEVKQAEKEKEVNFSHYNLNPNFLHIFYSDILMPDQYLRNAPSNFQYKFMTGSLEKMVQNIHKDIEDTAPKYLIIQCFGKVLYNRTNQSVIDFLYELINTVDSKGIHRIAPSTNHFLPAKPGSWMHCGHFNAEARIMNIDRGSPPLTLHKALMDRECIDYGPLLIKGPMWREYLKGQGLGHTLSRAGYKKYMHFILKAFENHFKEMNRKPSKRYMGTPFPPPLEETPGYFDNPAMMRILEEQGLLKVRNYQRSANVPPPNRFKAVDPPTTQQSATPRPPARQPSVPQPGQSKSCNDLNQTFRHSSEKERPHTWYGHNMVISEEGAARKVSLTGASSSINDSGVFNDSSRDERNYNEDHREDKARDVRKKYVTWEELDAAYELLKYNYDKDVKYYKEKVDNLIMDKEDLKDRVHDLREENDTLRIADDLQKTKIRSLQRQLDAKSEECDLKDDRIKLVEQHCRYIKGLHNDMGELFFEMNEKSDKKKKRNS